MIYTEACYSLYKRALLYKLLIKITFALLTSITLTTRLYMATVDCPLAVRDVSDRRVSESVLTEIDC